MNTKKELEKRRTERRKLAEELSRDVWNKIEGLAFVPLESQKERRKQLVQKKYTCKLPKFGERHKSIDSRSSAKPR